jgi:phage N-6-adenine-methyltransferase
MYADRATRQNVPWQTPKALFKQWCSEAPGGFKLDAFASAQNALCARYYTAEDDAIMQPWRAANASVFANPPYGGNMQSECFQKALTEVRTAKRCQEAWILQQANTSSAWFRAAVEQCEVWLFAGRINFDSPSSDRTKRSSSTFANVLIIVRDGGPTGIRGFRDPRTGKVVSTCQ